MSLIQILCHKVTPSTHLYFYSKICCAIKLHNFFILPLSMLRHKDAHFVILLHLHVHYCYTSFNIVPLSSLITLGQYWPVLFQVPHPLSVILALIRTSSADKQMHIIVSKLMTLHHALFRCDVITMGTAKLLF